MYLCAIYIFPGSVILLRSQIGRTIPGIYKFAHRYMNVGIGKQAPQFSFLGIHKSYFGTVWTLV
jgi:hypothetical protein